MKTISNTTNNEYRCGECAKYRSTIEARKKEGGRYTDAVFCVNASHFFVLPDFEACKEIRLEKNDALRITR